MARFTNSSAGSSKIDQVWADGDRFMDNAFVGKHVYMVSPGAIIIPTDNTINHPIGTTIVLVSGDNNAGIVCQDWGTTQIWGAGYNQTDAGSGWYITNRSMATIIKIDNDVWMVSGATLSLGW